MELGGIYVTSSDALANKVWGYKGVQSKLISKITENKYDIDWTNHHARLSAQ